MSSLHFKVVEVRGDSMSPNFNDGEWLLFRLLPTKAPAGKLIGKLIGKVVLIQRRSDLGADFLQVKRVIKAIKSIESIESTESDESDETKFWVEGDNKSVSTDSRSWGALDSTEVIGKLIFRYKKN